eukprot:g19469.t1
MEPESPAGRLSPGWCVLLIACLIVGFLLLVGVACCCYWCWWCLSGGKKQPPPPGGDGGAPGETTAKSKDDKDAGQEVEQDDSHLSVMDGAARQPAQHEEAATSKPGEGGDATATNKEGEVDATTGDAAASAPAEEKKEEEPTSDPEHLADLNKGSPEGADEDEKDEDAGE